MYKCFPYYYPFKSSTSALNLWHIPCKTVDFGLFISSSNVIYLIICKPCKEQYAGSTFKEDFKPGFRIHKSDVITGKDICGVAKHFLTKCTKLQQSNAIKLKTLKFN